MKTPVLIEREERLRIRFESASVGEEAFAAFLDARVKGLESAEATLDETVQARGKLRGVPVSAEAAVSLDRDARELTVEARGASVAGVPLPLWILGALRSYTLGLDPDPELPFEIRLSGLRVADGRLVVGR